MTIGRPAVSPSGCNMLQLVQAASACDMWGRSFSVISQTRTLGTVIYVYRSIGVVDFSASMCKYSSPMECPLDLVIPKGSLDPQFARVLTLTTRVLDRTNM